jgi:hypothetical protein
MVSSASMEVGVVNPKFFYKYGRELSLTRFETRDWKVLLDKLRPSALDVYTLLGPFDLLCKNYYTKRTYELINLFAEYEIPESWIGNPTPFEVDTIDRYNGFDLDWQKDVTLELTDANLKLLDKIQENWNSLDPSVRDKLIKSRAVFPNAVSMMSENNHGVRAFVFLKLPVNNPTAFQLHKMILEARVFHKWMSEIVGLYWSTCQDQYHCVVELQVNDWDRLRKFVMDDCQSINEINLQTSTHVVMYPVTNQVVPASVVLRGVPLAPKTVPKLRVEEVLAKKEGVETEFKATLRWDIRENKANKQMEKNVAKTVAAFMNTEGGILVIGMADDRTVYGLQADIELMGRKDIDGFETDLIRVLREYLGASNAAHVTYLSEKWEGKYVCLVYVDGSPAPVSRPVNLTDMSVSTRPEEFWVRIGSSTIQLNLTERDKYIRDHWPNYRG